MTIIRQRKKVLAFIGISAVFFLIISGCAGGKTKKNGPESQATTPKDKGPSPLYYDFGDVLIPNELKVNKKESFVYKTPGFSAGVLVLSGKIGTSSLIAFFENNMGKDNWRIISSFKSPRTVMLFQKESRWCMINITEKDFKTLVEVWVAPTINEAEAGLLK
ncbi:MAG: hypothetical protein L6247_00275 [Desulfobacteraceae bacterium]|nr:hypothetical protein [Pseudomonadota bacterium]MBU4463276.1 hypothetical protein [Pseudomonadota bacterium]MCG2754003.1 hypothetical protein [Desulfobacteraceae bacterium]